jgi:hypothetical protein
MLYRPEKYGISAHLCVGFKFANTSVPAGYLPLFRKNFYPIAIRILNKIDSHSGIFVTDAAHLFVVPVGSLKIIYGKCKVEFVVAEVVGFFSCAQPCQLEFVGGFPIAEEHQSEALVLRFVPPGLNQSQGLGVKIQTLLEIPDVDVVVIESEFHAAFS